MGSPMRCQLGEAITERIGRTPLFCLQRLPATHGVSDAVQILVKAEWYNPGGSVKDRAAWRIVQEAFRNGDLGGGRRLLDATSGNTGIAYAMLGAALGFGVTLVVPASISEERRVILAAYGAELVFSDPYEGTDGAIRLARQLAGERPDRYFYADQYSNPANWLAHYEGTGIEILDQTRGTVTHLVAGLGTTGTMMGTGRRLKEANPAIVLVGVQPDDPFHGLEGLKHLPTALVPAIYDPTLIDRMEFVETDEAYRLARELGRSEGLLVGPSAAAAVVAALRVARELERGVVVVILPDSGLKYLSTPIWQPEQR
ncbi:MAG: pyridoxal-phosphate dependent enzyme [Thermomicrobium sp.]|nr:pyridoxal-phosphate dependent enzyme [Thermomicrobium sp.]